MKLARVLIPAAVVGGLLLTGCTSGEVAQDAAGDACLPSGSASDAVKISGTPGVDAELTSKIENVEERERTVLKEGEGDAPEEGESLSIAMSMFVEASEEPLQQQPATDIVFAKDQLNDWAFDAVRCAVPGQQTAMVLPYDEMFGEAAAADTGIEGLADGDSVAVVLEFGEASENAEGEAGATGEPGTLEPDELLKKAEGKAAKASEGFPTVKLADDGSPTITMPKGSDGPSKLETATLIEGDGEEVQDGDRVYVNYRGVIWRTGEEFDSSWSRGEPTSFITTQVIGGFEKALVGQKVGSQVISVVPAEDGGYGAASLEQMGHEPDDVMVFVLDILGTVHAE